MPCHLEPLTLSLWWPKSEVAIMGKEQAYDVMSSLSAKTEKIEENYDTY